MSSTPPRDPYLAFRYGAYRIYAASYALAVIGSQIFATAVQWDLYDRTHSKVGLGLLGLINAIPIFALALPAGHVADTFPRKKILLLTQIFLILAPCLLAMTLSLGPQWQSPGVMYALVGINAVTLTFARPTRSALLINLVPREAYTNLITWNSSLFETCSWVGPAIAGLIIGWLGVRTAYLAAAASLLACLLLTLFLPDQPPASSSREPVSLATLLAGLRFVFRQELLWASMSLDLLAVLLGGATYLLPVFASDQLHTSPVGFGVLKAAPAIGAGAMAVLQAHRPIYRRAGRAMLWAVVGFGLATVGFGLSRSFVFSTLMLLLIGACDNISVVIRHTLVQSLTPDEMRGRVAAVNQVFIGASNELGGFESGLTAEWFGPVASVVGGGLGALLVTGVIALASPQLRRLKSLQDVETVTG